MNSAQKGNTVEIAYRGTLEDGTDFGAAPEDKPFKFRIGELAQLIDLEHAVIGMREGEEKVVKIPSEKAFGDYKKEFVVEVDRESLKNVQVEKGKKYQIPWKNGEKKVARVTALDDNHIVFDANHPLAGENLTFYIKLISIN